MLMCFKSKAWSEIFPPPSLIQYIDRTTKSDDGLFRFPAISQFGYPPDATSSLAIDTLVLIPAGRLETITQELRRPMGMPGALRQRSGPAPSG